MYRYGTRFYNVDNWRNCTVSYGTGTSTFPDVYVAYASPGYLPGQNNITRVLVRLYFVFCRIMVPVEVWSSVRVDVATAKFEIRRGPFAFAISLQVNGACSCSEGRRPPVRETSRFNGRD